MPRPRKLTLSAAAKVASETDPDAWNRMTPAERQALVDQVNDHHAKSWAAADHINRLFPGMARKR